MSMFGEGGMFSLHNCIIGNIPGSIGETSVIAILIGAVILISTGIASWRIMGSFLAGGLVMGALFNLMELNAYMTIDPVHQVVMGGFMFGMVSWPLIQLLQHQQIQVSTSTASSVVSSQL